MWGSFSQALRSSHRPHRSQVIKDRICSSLHCQSQLFTASRITASTSLQTNSMDHAVTHLRHRTSPLPERFPRKDGRSVEWPLGQAIQCCVHQTLPAALMAHSSTHEAGCGLSSRDTSALPRTPRRPGLNVWLAEKNILEASMPQGRLDTPQAMNTEGTAPSVGGWSVPMPKLVTCMGPRATPGSWLTQGCQQQESWGNS